MQSFADKIGQTQHKDHSRHFTKQEYTHINDLMEKIRNGDAYASDELIKTIKPFVDRTSKKLALKILGEDNIGDEVINDAVNNALVRLLSGNGSSNIFSGDPKGWDYLQTRIQNTLVDEFKKIQEAQQEEFVGSSPDSSYRNGKHIALDRDASNPEADLQEKEVTIALRNGLRSVTPRKEQILRGLFLDERTEENMGEELGVSKQRVEQIKKVALEDLRKPLPRNRRLKSAYLGDENPISR
jgi:RNA polymerase sigma factor (sigma-70 family)